MTKANTAGFTKGEWEVRKDDELIVCGNEVIAEVYTNNINDSHLIASAPSMYDALEIALIHIQHPDQYDHDEVIKHLKSVLAKARGEKGE